MVRFLLLFEPINSAVILEALLVFIFYFRIHSRHRYQISFVVLEKKLVPDGHCNNKEELTQKQMQCSCRGLGLTEPDLKPAGHMRNAVVSLVTVVHLQGSEFKKIHFQYLTFSHFCYLNTFVVKILGM